MAEHPLLPAVAVVAALVGYLLAAVRYGRLVQVLRTDPLTGCLVRGTLQSLLAACGRRWVGVVLADVDGLKAVNDSQGHAAGDRLLAAVGQVLRANVRPEDHVVRLGGDEFLVLCPGTREDEIVFIARRLRRALEEAGLPASVGAAACGPGADLAGTVRLADLLMYEEKARRKLPGYVAG
ncbi:MAG: GGDEF domain-containing protein [Bacillota bacterium]